MKQLWFIFATVLLNVKGILIVDDVILETNKSLGVVKVDVFREPLKDSIMAATVKTFVTFKAASLYVTVNLPANQHDREYSREFMKTVVDLRKLMNGVYANPLLKSAMENILKAIDFELKFPFPAGTYSVQNFSLTDKFVILMIETKIKVDLRFVAQPIGTKKKVFGGRALFFGRYQPSPRSPKV